MQPGACKNPWLACILAKNPASHPASRRDRGSGSESRTASQVELLHATLPALLATNRAMVRLAILELNYKTETIFALIESPSDKHQRHARRYSTNVSRIHTAIRQKSAAYTPLFNKCQRHTHRYLTNVSGIYTAIRQNSAAYSPLFDKCQRYTPRYSTRSTCTAIYVHRTRACVHIFATRIPNKFAV